MEGQSGGRAGEEAECIGKSQGLTFWLARPEDYHEVMSISEDIYWGNDYLPYRYHIWMTQPHRLVILARKNSKLVRLEMLELLATLGHTLGWSHLPVTFSGSMLKYP